MVNFKIIFLYSILEFKDVKLIIPYRLFERFFLKFTSTKLPTMYYDVDYFILYLYYRYQTLGCQSGRTIPAVIQRSTLRVLQHTYHRSNGRTTNFVQMTNLMFTVLVFCFGRCSQRKKHMKAAITVNYSFKQVLCIFWTSYLIIIAPNYIYTSTILFHCRVF